MDDSHSNTSDLIYLYLDGEADSVQHAMLFGALARNSELQAEFTEALRIRAAIEQERHAALPPAHLTDDLFRRAGFATAAADTSATAGPGAFGTFLGRFGAPLLSAAASAVLTALILAGIYQSRLDAISGEMLRTRPAAAIETRPERTGPPPANAAPEKSGPGFAQNFSAPHQTARSFDGATDRTPHVARGAGSGSRGISPAASPRHERTPALAPVRTIAEAETAPPAAPVALMEPAPLRAEPVAIADPLISEPIMAAPIQLEPGLAAGDLPDHRFTVQLRGITGLGLYPERQQEQEGTQPWFNNMSIAALYHVSRHHAVGAEAGQESFPLYRSNGTASWLEPRLAWAGGVYRFETDGLESMGNLRPFLQTTIGGTPSGPLAKGIAGFTYTPDSRVDLSVGIEGTALLYQLQGSWYSVRKSGITYLMNVHF